MSQRLMPGNSGRLRGSAASLADRVFARLLPLCCGLLVGCQGGDPQPVPVSGVVRLNGKPLDHGEVMFIPDDTERGRSGRGQIGADGK